MFWREWIAKSAVGEELHLVIIEDLSPKRAPDEPACELMVSRHYLSRDRKWIASVEFSDLAQAQAYCQKEYGVVLHNWTNKITFRRSYEFNYQVSSQGVFQAHPITPLGTKIVFRSTIFEDEDGQTKHGLTICGNREGFEELAAMFMLFADSEKYDPDFHIHLEDHGEVEADLNVLIQMPAALEFVRAPEYRTFKGTSIPIPPDDAEDQDTSAHPVGPVPADCTYRREEIYGDDGR